MQPEMNTRSLVTSAAVTGMVSAAAMLIFQGVQSLFKAQSALGAWRRIAYQDGEYLVAVRGGYDEWNNIKEFVQPLDPMVQSIYQEIGPDWWECFRYVCEQIDYAGERVEFWRWPAETLKGKGDCEDTSILLASILRNFTDAQVAVGTYCGFGHAWVELDKTILETTLTEPFMVNDPENYHTYFCFNDQETCEIWPGSLGEILATVRRNQLAKTRLLAGVLTNS